MLSSFRSHQSTSQPKTDKSKIRLIRVHILFDTVQV